jgi:hypothetical protein
MSDMNNYEVNALRADAATGEFDYAEQTTARKPLTATTAQEIAAAIPGILRDRADREDSRDWGTMNSYRRYVALLNTGAAWAVNGNTVAASVYGPDAELWGQAVADAFDTASQDYDLPNGHIHDNAPGLYVFDLDCECGGACTLPAE